MKVSILLLQVHYLLLPPLLAQDVACLVDNQQVAVVDLDTGVCPFTIPASLAALHICFP